MLQCGLVLLILCVFTKGDRPKITEISEKVVKSVGQNAIVSCVFESTAPNFNVSWLKDNVPIIFDNRVFEKSNGKTMRVLFLNSLVPSDKGRYTCRGKNDDGITDGNVIVELIEVKPKIQHIDKVYLKQNEGINLTCSSVAVPEATHKWMRKGGIFGSNVVDHKNGVLEIKKLDSNLETYTCTATNAFGEDSIQVDVQQVTGIVWVEEPKDSNVTAGTAFTFTVSLASVTAPKKIDWYKNHMLIPSQKYSTTRIGSKHISELHFEDVKVDDTAVYRAIVDLGTVSSLIKTARLTVFSKPDISIEEGTEIFVTAGNDVTFTCIVHAYPQAMLQWEKNGTVILRADKSNTVVDGFRTTFPLKLGGVEKTGFYTCAGENDQGNSKKLVKMNVSPSTGGGTENNRDNIIAVVVVSIIVIIIIMVAAFVYIKYRHRICISEYTQASGKFYTDVVDEEQNISTLEDIENNKYAIKKNINISLRKGDRSNSISQHNKINDSIKGKSLRQTLKGLSIKRPSNAFENHYARLGTVVCQGRAIDFKHIVFDECLGTGEYGLVNGGRIIDDDNATVFKEVSIKMLKDNWEPEHMRDMLAELRMMRRITKHRNVISLIGWCKTDDNVYVIEEYVPFGSLLTFLRAQRCLNQSREALDQLAVEDRVDSNTLLSFATQIAAGMNHLAQLQVVHRDLACRNVYLGYEKTCKISEYGLIRDIYAENVYRKTTGGQLPVRWMAKESIFEGVYSHESDVWSFGVLLWELVNLGKIPYPGIVRTEHLLNELESGYHMENPGHISTDLFLIMCQCWNHEPSRRPTFEKLERNLNELLNDTEEEHIDLSKLLKSEYDEDMTVNDEILTSPTVDFHRPNPFNRLKDVTEENEDENEDVSNSVNA